MKRPAFSSVLVVCSACVFFVALILIALNAHSKIPADRMWEMLQKPACFHWILMALAVAGLLLAGAIRVASSARCPDTPRRRLAVAGAVVLGVAALSSTVFASWPVNTLIASRVISEALNGNAYFSVIHILDFRHHPKTLMDGDSWEAWIEFSVATTKDFADTLQPAALGDETYAVRTAQKVFPAFRPASPDTVRCVRAESGFEGWVIPGESPNHCVILAWRGVNFSHD